MSDIELCDHNHCTGCGACYNVCSKNAISMYKDKEGFLYPFINKELCVNCGLCVSKCPILNPIKKFDVANNPIAALAKSDEIRMKSSSGGIFSLLAHYILSQGGVVFGAVMNEKFEVYHTVAHNHLELEKLRGSKYVQSDTQKTFLEVKKYLLRGVYVLYVGTPCEIAGLRKSMPTSITEKLFTIDLVCHGTPSSKAFHVYLKKLSEKNGINLEEIVDFQFRQLEGWGCDPSYKNSLGEKFCIRGKNNLYMNLFLSSKLHRYSCYNCLFATESRIGDITLADFWGVNAQKPFGFDTSKGCSLVLINSSKGEFLYGKIKKDIYEEERTWSEAKKINHQLYKAVKKPKDRNVVYYRLFEWPYDKVYNYYYNSLWFKIKRSVGKLLITMRIR